MTPDQSAEAVAGACHFIISSIPFFISLVVGSVPCVSRPSPFRFVGRRRTLPKQASAYWLVAE